MHRFYDIMVDIYRDKERKEQEEKYYQKLERERKCRVGCIVFMVFAVIVGIALAIIFACKPREVRDELNK